MDIMIGNNNNIKNSVIGEKNDESKSEHHYKKVFLDIIVALISGLLVAWLTGLLKL